MGHLPTLVKATCNLTVLQHVLLVGISTSTFRFPAVKIERLFYGHGCCLPWFRMYAVQQVSPPVCVEENTK